MSENEETLSWAITSSCARRPSVILPCLQGQTDPKVLEHAETVPAEIERDAKTKQSAIEAILGTAGATKGPRRRAPA